MRSIWHVVKETFRVIVEDDCMGVAGQIAYHWVFSLFPGLFVLAAVLSLLGGNAEFMDSLTQGLSTLAPTGTASLVRGTLETMRRAAPHSSIQVLSLGLLTMSWVASNGFAVIMGTLNRAYDLGESRPFWRRRLLAMVLVFLVGLALVAAVHVLVAGSGFLLDALARTPLGPTFVGLLHWGRWPVYSGLAFGVAAILYAVAPALPRVDWRWTLPGAVVFAVLWLTAGYFFTQYLSRFAAMDRLYGALGAFLVLLGWLYLTAFAFLVGGEVNGRIRCAHLDRVRQVQAETAAAAVAAALREPVPEGEPVLIEEGGL